MEREMDIPRYQPDNPFKFTPLELAKRKKALMEMERDYPHLPWQWLEMTYDYCATTPPNELDQIIEERRFETPGRFTNNGGKHKASLKHL